MQGKRSNLPGLLGKKLTMVCWRVDATPLQFFLCSSFPLFFAFCVFVFLLPLSSLLFFLFLSGPVSLFFFFCLSLCFLCFFFFFFCSVFVLCSPLLSLYFARVSVFFLLECPVSGAVTAEDGALELLLKTKCNGLTLCFSLQFVRPLSLCSFFFFFSLYWFSRPCSLWFFFFFLPPSFMALPPCGRLQIMRRPTVVNAGAASWAAGRGVSFPWFGELKKMNSFL